MLLHSFFFFFFFNDTATTEIYTLSLHDALPISAPKAMLTVLLMKMQENDFSHETMRDLVGEVANMISGNVRRDFGRDFVISVPSVLSGEKPQIRYKPGMRSFIIPINWRSHSAKLIVALT